MEQEPEITRFYTWEFKQKTAPTPDHYWFRDRWIHAATEVTIKYNNCCPCIWLCEIHSLELVYPDCGGEIMSWNFDTRQEALAELSKIRKFVEAYWRRKQNRTAMAVPMAVPTAVVMDVDVEAQVAKTE
jgi:hypothetical protein